MLESFNRSSTVNRTYVTLQGLQNNWPSMGNGGGPGGRVGGVSLPIPKVHDSNPISYICTLANAIESVVTEKY